jgi:hypothetical protein
MEVLNQVIDILESDEGFDPYRQAYIRVQETRTIVQGYDKAIVDAIEQSSDRPVLRCIDRCLWLYVDQRPANTPQEYLEAFTAALFGLSPSIRDWNRVQCESDILVGAVALDANLFVPEAVPLLLRQLPPNVIRDILLGGLKGRVLLYLDWVEFGHVIEDLGAQLTWSSRKAGRAQTSKPYPKRSMTVGERVPRIQLPDGRYVGGLSKVYRILFDGMLPSVIAAQYVEFLQHMELPSAGEQSPPSGPRRG